MPAYVSETCSFIQYHLPAHEHVVARRNTDRHIHKQRPERASQSAVMASQKEPGGQSIGAIEGDQGSAAPDPPGPSQILRMEATAGSVNA
jgi:hypothetical protein